VYDLAHNFEKTSLMRITSDPASKKSRLRSTVYVGRGEAAGGCAKHGEIVLSVADGDRFGIIC
jgi:hypothetical protein